MLLPILRAATHTVRDTHAIGSVADDNLGMFGITEMAMKIAGAPLPGAPHLRNSKQGKNLTQKPTWPDQQEQRAAF